MIPCKKNPLTPGALLAAAWMILSSCAFPVDADSADSKKTARDDEPVVNTTEVLAIVTKMSGTAKTTDGKFPVRVFQVVRNGTSFELAPGAWLEIACEGVVVRIEESGPVSSEHCRRADRRARTLVPYQGRVNMWNGSPVLEGETRLGADHGPRPVLISPSCPNEMSRDLECARFLETPHEIVWTEVEGALKYEITLGGAGEPLTVTEPECHADVIQRQVCSAPWPQDWRIVPGEIRFLHVTAQIDLFDKATSEKTKIALLDADEAARIREEVAAIERLGLDAPMSGLALASFFAEHKLYNEAVEVLDEMTHQDSEPQLHLALSDAYLKVALVEKASWHYRQVLDRTGEDDAQAREMRAAAELGLGWANYLDDRPAPALEHFRTAVALSKQAQLPELTAQACDMVERIEKLL